VKTDNIVLLEAMDALIARLGLVDVGRFISLIKRDPFDYTEWQRYLWNDKSIEEIYAAGTEREKKNGA
jgi:hypothetical protein